ncbi:MAG: hypothetical protein AAF501_20660, partial [Pseudomonadota bacterium]
MGWIVRSPTLKLAELARIQSARVDVFGLWNFRILMISGNVGRRLERIGVGVLVLIDPFCPPQGLCITRGDWRRHRRFRHRDDTLRHRLGLPLGRIIGGTDFQCGLEQ